MVVRRSVPLAGVYMANVIFHIFVQHADVILNGHSAKKVLAPAELTVIDHVRYIELVVDLTDHLAQHLFTALVLPLAGFRHGADVLFDPQKTWLGEGQVAAADIETQKGEASGRIYRHTLAGMDLKSFGCKHGCGNSFGFVCVRTEDEQIIRIPVIKDIQFGNRLVHISQEIICEEWADRKALGYALVDVLYLSVLVKNHIIVQIIPYDTVNAAATIQFAQRLISGFF